MNEKQKTTHIAPQDAQGYVAFLEEKVASLQDELASLQDEVARQRKINKTIARDVLNGSKTGYEEWLASLQAEVARMEGALIQIANLWAVSGDSSDLLMQASGIASNALLSKK